ncbi:MAG: hypothetical protein AAFN92_14745, partial [Bacteroidota bacterium]
MQRRAFLTTGLALPTALSLSATPSARTPLPEEAKFRISLKADAIGVNGGPTEMLEAASKHGYGALSVPAEWLEGMSTQDKEKFARSAEKADITWGANGLPIEFRKSEDRFKADLGAVPQQAKN